MYIAGIGNIEKLGDPALTDDQLRQIAASRNAGISQSVQAAETAGAQGQSVAAFNEAVSSAVAALQASTVPKKGMATWFILGGVGFAAYLLLRRKRSRRRVLHSRKRRK